jgi:LmbE family N-acetylglucosaminyl deacetylase
MTCRTVTVDANFHADHIRMHRLDLDIMLIDGQEGYMVEEVCFKEYLSVAKKMHGVNLD